MKKQSVIFMLLGILFLVIGYGAYVMLTKSGARETDGTSRQTYETNDTSSKLSIDIVISSNPDEVQSIRVKQGQNVNVSFTSEVTDDAHLHGYDIVTPLTPEQKASMSFIADKTGRFELELESSRRLVAIFEVYP